jgi:transcriptional regulator with XRE-family HTH domain
LTKNAYQEFGEKLKTIRQKAKETIDEVSAAVEMEALAIKDLEQGKAKPSEDLILMLISHFDLSEREAVSLWQLAGYSPAKTNIAGLSPDGKGIVQMAFISAADAKVIYTDMVNVSSNRFGVVINFLQGLGGSSQPLAVSRIGMSHAHAKSLIEALQKTVKLTENSTTQDKKPTK